MEEKIFAGLLTLAMVMAFIFSIEALAHLKAPTPRAAVPPHLSSDFQIFNEQVP